MAAISVAVRTVTRGGLTAARVPYARARMRARRDASSAVVRGTRPEEELRCDSGRAVALNSRLPTRQT